MPEILEVRVGIEEHDDGPSPDGAHHNEGEGGGKDRLDESSLENVPYIFCRDGCSLGYVPSDEEPEQDTKDWNAHPHSNTDQINGDKNRKGSLGVQFKKVY